MRSVGKLIGIVLSLLVAESKAEQVVLDNIFDAVPIDKGLSVHTRTSDTSLAYILNKAEFKSLEEGFPNLGVTTNTHWLRFSVKNQLEEKNLLFQIDNPILDRVILYQVQNGQVVNEIATGEEVAIDNRSIKHQNFLFPVEIPTGATREFILKVQNSEQIFVPISVGTVKSIYRDLLNKDLIMGAYFGLILVMFLYNLFIYFTVRDTSYLIYVFYILSVGFVQLNIEGYTYKMLWSSNTYIPTIAIYFFNALTAVLSVLFMQKFIKLRQFFPRLNKGLYLFLSIYAIALLLAFIGVFDVAYNLMNLCALLLSFYMLALAIMAVRKGSRPARFFLIAWSTFLGSIILFVLKDAGVLPYNTLTASILQLGSGAEVILLSFGLADRINTLKKEKAISQQKALEASKENERLIREQNVQLEDKVKERTKELEEALIDLKNAQTQLVDQEKMASLGQLTAGIAHEINNPINFVTGNVKPLSRDLEDIFELIDGYEALDSVEKYQEKWAQVQELKEEIELDFLRDEVRSLLTGIEEGATRTAEIVRGLKVFSRMDEQDLKSVDLVEGIESTITLLRSSMNDRITVHREFQDVGRVECFAGKLNQVFMNMISNSIHAILNKQDQDEGNLWLRLKNAGDRNVQIEIEDDGMGMPEEVKEKIFEPFFTTKKVGEGTGLGMSISFSIIEKHKGSIQVVSEKGKGTKFTITIPKTH